MNSIKNNNSTNSNYAEHILEMNRMHGTIENTMEVLQVTSKGKYTNTLKKFHICNLSKQNQHLNDDTITKSLISNPLTPELNPSEQCCLPEFFPGDFKF
jgi:hypothetical protein